MAIGDRQDHRRHFLPSANVVNIGACFQQRARGFHLPVPRGEQQGGHPAHHRGSAPFLLLLGSGRDVLVSRSVFGLLGLRAGMLFELIDLSRELLHLRLQIGDLGC